MCIGFALVAVWTIRRKWLSVLPFLGGGVLWAALVIIPMAIQNQMLTGSWPDNLQRAKTYIGSIRRECLDHVIVFSEGSLRRTLAAYCAYYHQWRTHLSLDKDAPQPRRRQPATEGPVVEMPEVGGLHHHYERRAA